MTDNMKKFGALLSKDEGVKKELEAALSGLDKNDKNAFTAAAIKVAAKHGITLTEADLMKEAKELSEDEMKAVAGGGAFCDTYWLNLICLASSNKF